jgi:hypothetical protein
LPVDLSDHYRTATCSPVDHRPAGSIFGSLIAFVVGGLIGFLFGLIEALLLGLSATLLRWAQMPIGGSVRPVSDRDGGTTMTIAN